MPEKIVSILLDQNIPFAVAAWLRSQRPSWKIWHVNDLGFEGSTDEFLYRWAQQEKAIVLTFDEDFADARLYPLGMHHGVVRLRIWPTTTEKTIEALTRLMDCVPLEEWIESLIIIGDKKIRIRRFTSS
jgi:predicted nuclease of predicted toxin-antitoxin system